MHFRAVLVSEGRAIAHAASRPLTANVRVPVPDNPLNAELNPICHLQALLGAHHILHVSRIRVNPREICGGQSGTGTGFSTITSVSPRH